MTAIISSARERIGSPLLLIAGVVGIAMSVLVLWYTFEGALMPRRQQANLVLGASVLVYYFNKAYELRAEAADLDRRQLLVLAWFLLAGIAGLLAAGYVQLNYQRWVQNSSLLIYNDVDLVVGATLMIVAIDMTFRSFGKALGFAVVAALVYGLTGPFWPGVWGHSGLSIPDLIARETILLDGVYGSLLQIAATWVAIFILFAGFVEALGGFDFIHKVGRRVAVMARSGVAQSAVISSMFIGMLTGGAAVNVALTGSFTIPMMKEHEIPGQVAAGIESMASSGGQILPPIMGLAAFLIADFIGRSYADVVISATIPALLFYGTVAVAVHIVILSSGWTPTITREEVLADAETTGLRFLAEGLQYLVPLVVLVYFLIVLRFPIMLSGGYTIGTFILLRAAYVFSPLSPDEVSTGRAVEFGENLVTGLWLGAKRLAPFVGLLGALGMLTTILAYTGLGQRLATTILIAGGETVVIILILVMFVSLLFGLGMPTPAAYILVATVLAPALVRIGLGEMTAHLYVFYFALLSSITPPVAIAVAVASEIAESDFLQSCKSTLVIGGPVFAIPFLFVANPELLEWSFPGVVINTVLIAIGMLGLVFAFTGSNGNREFGAVERALLLIAFPVIGFYPGTTVRTVAALVVLVVGVRGFVLRRLPGRAESA